MVVVAVACLPIFFTGFEIARWEGATFLFYYGAYAAYPVLKAKQSPALAFFRETMLLYIIPLTVAVVLMLAMSSLRKKGRRV